MLKNQIYALSILLFLATNILAQNDNAQIPQDDTFYIQSAINYGKSNDGFWDLPGEKDFAIGQKFSVYNYIPETQINRFQFGQSIAADRKFKFITSENSEYLKIKLSSVNAFVDVVGGESNNGTEIQVYEGNKTSSQNFRFKYMNDGRFKIYNENGKIINLSNRSSANGSSIILWDDHDGPWTEWVLISETTRKPLILPNKAEITSCQKDWADMGGINRFIIQSANNYGKDNGGFWDIPGNNEPQKGDNIQVWDLGNVASDRIYSVMEAQNKGYYNIFVGTNTDLDLVIDLAENGYKNGTNIGVWESENNAAQNFYFKHLGNGKFNIFNENGKVICLNNGSSNNGSNIITWVEHGVESAEWYLLDIETKKAFIPYPVPTDLSSIKIDNFPGEESKKLAANIDKTYLEIRKTEKRFKALNNKAKGARNILKDTKSVSVNIGKLNSEVKRTSSVISVLQRLPIIGTPATVLGSAINQVDGKLNNASITVKNLEKSTLGPTLNGAYIVNEAVYSIEQKLTDINKDIFSTKVNYSKAATCVANSNDQAVINTFEQNSSKIAVKLVNINSALEDVNKSISELEKITDSISKLKSKIEPVKKAVHDIEKAFKEADKVAKEIDKVLEKRLKKKIFGVGVDISLKKALNVGKKYIKKVTDEINKWVGKALKPILQKLNIKIPSINVDGLKAELENLNSLPKEFEKQKAKLTSQISNLTNLKDELKKSVDDCLSAPPCKFNETVDLNNISLVESDSGARSDPTKPLPVAVDLTPNLEFTEGFYDNIFNLNTLLPMEVRTAKVGDAVDDLFDQAGLSSANSRAADVYTGIGFQNNSPLQKFFIKHQGNGYYSIYNEYTKMALTVENGSQDAEANVVPQEFKGKDNQLFLIIRDNEQYRYGAFIVAKHSKMALGIGLHGSVIQKELNPNDKSQVWAFSNRKIWKNEAGYIGVKKLTLAKEYASLSNDTKTAGWNYIIHPSYKNAYYLQNANSTLFLSSEENYDKDNVLKSYKLIQTPYVKGATSSMLFYMSFTDETEKKVAIIDAMARYKLDVDKDSKNLILVPQNEASILSEWEMLSDFK